jgi:hypothetical protein
MGGPSISQSLQQGKASQLILAIYGPMIYTGHMRNAFDAGRYITRANERGLGPVKWHRAVRWVPFGAQRSLRMYLNCLLFIIHTYSLFFLPFVQCDGGLYVLCVHPFRRVLFLVTVNHAQSGPTFLKLSLRKFYSAVSWCFCTKLYSTTRNIVTSGFPHVPVKYCCFSLRTDVN